MPPRSRRRRRIAGSLAASERPPDSGSGHQRLRVLPRRLELYDFIYAELCDWYLELVKPRLYDGDAATQATLLHVLTETVTLAHPLIPFVTEEIYSHIPGAQGLLAARVAPVQAGLRDHQAEEAVERVIAAVQAVRTWRDAADVKPSRCCRRICAPTVTPRPPLT